MAQMLAPEIVKVVKSICASVRPNEPERIAMIPTIALSETETIKK
jgi:hypothetical protein